MTGSDWAFRDYYAGVEDPNVNYTIILVEGEQLPLAVVRLTDGVEEAFTHTLRWEPSDLLSRVPAEPTWTTRPANVGYANGFLVEMIKVVRARTHLSEFADYKYFAYFRSTLDVLDLDKAHALIRRPEYYGDEEYTGHNMWEDTDRPHDVDRMEDTQGEYIAISQAEAGGGRSRSGRSPSRRGCGPPRTRRAEPARAPAPVSDPDVPDDVRGHRHMTFASSSAPSPPGSSPPNRTRPAPSARSVPASRRATWPISAAGSSRPAGRRWRPSPTSRRAPSSRPCANWPGTGPATTTGGSNGG